MNPRLISSNIHCLDTIILLLNELNDESYINASVGPYYSSIGSHIRHILDYFYSIINGLHTNTIDLTNRNRDSVISEKIDIAKDHVLSIKGILGTFTSLDEDKKLAVKDDLGSGLITIEYSLESILAQAHCHTIHHFAAIGYLLHIFKLNINIKGFGYNPTTPILQ